MPDSKKASPIATALSGAVAGALVSACVQPFDVVRTKMQAETMKNSALTSVATLKLIVRDHGVSGLWRGVGPSVWRLGLGAGVNFLLLEGLKNVLTAAKEGTHDTPQRLSALEALVSGSVARSISTALMCPVTVVKTRMEYVSQGTAPMYRSTAHALRDIAATEGVRGLFRGLPATLLTNAPFSGLYYMFYSGLKERIQGSQVLLFQPLPAVAVNFSCGVVAAAGATLLTQPADVVRTRLQLGGVQGGVQGLKAALQLVASGGPNVFMAGFTPRFMKRTLQTALVWAIYEELVPRLTEALDSVGRGQAFGLSLQGVVPEKLVLTSQAPTESLA